MKHTPHADALHIWLEKTDWVQKSAQPGELGMHLADVLKARIERKDALLRRALTVIGHCIPRNEDNADELMAAIYEEIKQ